MAQNKVRLRVHPLAYNLGVFLQATELPEEMTDWSLTGLQTRLIKIRARVVRHARAITFQVAEVAVSSDLFHSMRTAIHGLRAPTASAARPERTRLDRSFQTGTNQTESRSGLGFETRQRAQLARQMSERRHWLLRRVDRRGKSQQTHGKNVPLGECR